MDTTPKPKASVPGQLGTADSEPCRELCALHVIVPSEARQRAKIAALQSGLPFKDYVARLLFNARPFADQAEGRSNGPGDVQDG